MRNVLPWITRMALVAAVMAIGGCGGDEPAVQKTKKEGYTIAFYQCDMDNAWHKQMWEDIQAAAKKANIKVVMHDAAGSVKKQKSQIGKALADGADLLIIHPIKTQDLTEPVAKVFADGTPVIVLQRPVIGDQFTCFIKTDEQQIGSVAGQWLAEHFTDKANIIELKCPDTTEPARDRHVGFADALKDPRFRIVREAVVKPTEAAGHEKMKEFLELDRIDAVYAHEAVVARGAYRAAKEAGREKEILFIGVGKLAGKELTAAVPYATGGTEAIAQALKIRHNKQVSKKITPTISIRTPK